MPSQYRYIDPDYTYTDPKTGVLKNLANATDNDTLILIESGMVAKRIAELQENPIKIKKTSTLLDIHKHLFQDIYLWAGEVRTVEISKQGNPFFPLAYFHNAFAFIDTLIVEYRKIDREDKTQLAHKLAEILDGINHLHPFREGNGRAQREFLRLLAMEKGLSLDLNPPDNVEVYERYMSGTINGNVEQLAALISKIIA
jgi:cell filamentation protein